MLTEVPTPKYKIGDVVWLGSTECDVAQFPCPDCKDTKKWTITTPGGGVYETTCQRCSRHFNQYNVPSLFYEVHKPVATRLTIVSIRIETDFHDENYGPISYMCSETSSHRSGSTYYERKSFFRTTEVQALEDASLQASLKNSEAHAQPEILEKRYLSGFTIEKASIEAADRSVWSAWYAYRRVMEDLIESCKDDASEKGLLEHLRDNVLRWEFGPHGNPPKLHELLTLVSDVREAVEKVPVTSSIAVTVTELCDWFDKLPDDLKPFAPPAAPVDDIPY